MDGAFRNGRLFHSGNQCLLYQLTADQDANTQSMVKVIQQHITTKHHCNNNIHRNTIIGFADLAQHCSSSLSSQWIVFIYYSSPEMSLVIFSISYLSSH